MCGNVGGRARFHFVSPPQRTYHGDVPIAILHRVLEHHVVLGWIGVAVVFLGRWQLLLVKAADVSKCGVHIAYLTPDATDVRRATWGAGRRTEDARATDHVRVGPGMGNT